MSEVPEGTLGICNNKLLAIANLLHVLLIIAIDDSHLSVVTTALSTVYQWFQLGIHLGLSFSTLKTIEINERGNVEMCRISMLDTWLKSPEEKRSKNVLQSALKQLAHDPNQVSLFVCVHVAIIT